jgi:hypothetical protein
VDLQSPNPVEILCFQGLFSYKVNEENLLRDRLGTSADVVRDKPCGAGRGEEQEPF